MSNILIVSEKPVVGKAIAKALKVKGTIKYDGYIEGYSEIFGVTIWITWCIGHLVEMCNPD
jgi:DNA topoisomerase IA